MDLPAIPEDVIDPNQPVVGFELISCRQCGSNSGWHLITEPYAIAITVYNWQEGHGTRTDHSSYYRFKIERGTSRFGLF